MKEEIPSRVYKYRAPTILDLSALAASKLWISDPNAFNDPFDCSWEPRFAPAGRDQWIEAILYVTKGQLSRQEINVHLNNVAQEHVERSLEKVVADGLNRARGFCCFSAGEAIPCNPLLWSHYSDGHRGFCLEFDTSADPLFQKLNPVQYTNERPLLNVHELARGNLVQGLNTLLTKAQCWEYEREWRVIHERQRLLYGYQPASLTAVYFGLKMTAEVGIIIGNLLSMTDTKLFQMCRDNERFEMEAKPVTYEQLDYRKRAVT